MHDGVHQIYITHLSSPLCISAQHSFLFELTYISSAHTHRVLVPAQIMALLLSPWCGRRARPFTTCGSASLMFRDVAVIKVPPMMMMPSQACGRMSQAVQWTETPESHVFKLRLSGMKKEDVSVQVEDDRTLYISYSDHQFKGEERAATFDKLQKHGFMRKFKLSENAEVEQIRAEVADETLTVTVPKRKMDARRVIEVSEGADSQPAASFDCYSTIRRI